jgi:hypothetical protein
MPEANAEAYDASVRPATEDEVVYLTTRVDEITASIDKAKAVAAGAKETERSLRDELKTVQAELASARKTLED